MSPEREPQPPSPLFDKLLEMTNPNKPQLIGKQTKFGTVDVQRIFGVPGLEDHVEVQVHSPEPNNIWTVFKISSDGNIKTEVKEGGFSKTQDVEPAFTLEELLAEIQ